MSRRAPDPCWDCGAEFTTARESMLHYPCPQSPPRGAGHTTVTRAVSCPRCASQIDLRVGPTCPDCGFDYPFAPATSERPVR